ncbi:MAG: hypothetical protein KBC28_10305 [Alphaproteobacteria bacterium]|nr:hypothetical protein [Alphaproteobacteria bacterium]
MSIETLIKKAFHNSFKIDPSEFSSDLAFGSIMEWDSLGHVGLMCELEKTIGIQIPNSQFPQLNSYENINNYFYKLHTNQNMVNKKIKTANATSAKIHHGLKEIYYDTSEICLIDIEQGLYYRGYHINELVSSYSFEETAYLLLAGKFPSPQKLQDIHTIIRRNFKVDEDIIFLDKNIKNINIINLFKFFISMQENKYENLDDYIENVFALLGKLAAILIFKKNKLEGKENLIPLEPLETISYNLAAAFYPSNIEQAEIFFRKDLIIHAEHESNASTFTGRITASTKASVSNALTAAIDTFSGDLHGGALNKIDEQLDILKGLPCNSIDKYIRTKWDKKELIYGFGHRVYVGEDPRSVIYKNILCDLKENGIFDNSLEIAKNLEAAVKKVCKKGFNPNVDLYCSVSYRSLAINREFHVPLFIISRLIGWLAHIWEQNNNLTIIRPRLCYVGNQPSL